MGGSGAAVGEARLSLRAGYGMWICEACREGRPEARLLRRLVQLFVVGACCSAPQAAENSKLADLDLGYNEIKDDGACAIAQVGKLGGVRVGVAWRSAGCRTA